MRSKVMETVRDEQRTEQLALSADERVKRMFALGEQQIQTFMAAQGITREEALRRIERGKQAGRQPSRVMEQIIDASRPNGTRHPR